MLQEKKAKEMEELAATLAELGIQNVAPGEEEAAPNETSKRKKKKEKGKGADKEAKPEDATEANGVPESRQEPPAAAAVAAESTPEASGEPEELVDPKEVRSPSQIALIVLLRSVLAGASFVLRMSIMPIVSAQAMPMPMSVFLTSFGATSAQSVHLHQPPCQVPGLD